MNMKLIFFAVLCPPFFTQAQFSSADILMATVMSIGYIANPATHSIAKKMPAAPDYHPTLKRIGSTFNSPHAYPIGVAFCVSFFGHKDANPGTNRIVNRQEYAENILQSIGGATVGCAGTKLIDQALNKLGYGQDSMYVRPVVLFFGSIGTQLAGQMIVSKLAAAVSDNNRPQIPQIIPANQNHNNQDVLRFIPLGFNQHSNAARNVLGR